MAVKGNPPFIFGYKKSALRSEVRQNNNMMGLLRENLMGYVLTLERLKNVWYNLF